MLLPPDLPWLRCFLPLESVDDDEDEKSESGSLDDSFESSSPPMSRRPCLRRRSLLADVDDAAAAVDMAAAVAFNCCCCGGGMCAGVWKLKLLGLRGVKFNCGTTVTEFGVSSTTGWPGVVGVGVSTITGC